MIEGSGSITLTNGIWEAQKPDSNPEHCLENSKSLNRDDEINWHLFAPPVTWILWRCETGKSANLFTTYFHISKFCTSTDGFKHFLLSKIENCTNVAARFYENTVLFPVDFSSSKPLR